MATSLRDKVVLVTGASSGIGKATAKALAEQGAKLALAARSGDKLSVLAAELGNALAIPTDLTKPQGIAGMVEQTLGHFGQIDVLFANAGLYIPGPVAEGQPDDWDTLLMVNVNAVFRCVRAVLPHMLQRGSGDILMTSSISGHQAIHWEPVYSASKHAIQSFVHGLRRQVSAQGVRVGAIAPGIVLNELWGYTDPAAIETKVQQRAGLRCEDVAEAIVFMLTRPANVTIRDLVILPQNQDI